MTIPFAESLCHRCAAPLRYIRTARSLFLRCPLVADKYPRQPVLRCTQFRPALVTTSRVALRPLEPGDLDFVATMLADPEVMRFYPKPLDRVEAAAWIARMQARQACDGHGLWLVLSRDHAAPVGQVGLLRQTVEGIDEVEIGYLLHRPFWGQGLATEAAMAVRDWAFAQGHPSVISLIRPANEPSQAVAQRLGMSPGPVVLHAGLDHIVWRIATTR